MALDHQIRTLSAQLDIVQNLAARGIQPTAVLGYCFGEYAAAVAAGILSEETAVNILVRRSAAMRSFEGAMLNVFCEISLLQRLLARLSDPPSIAIYASGSHHILSGSFQAIQCANDELRRNGVKTVPLGPSPPFHSKLMDTPSARLVPFTYSVKESKVAYISGVVGAELPPHQLGIKYWLRHMRDPVHFFRSMQYVRRVYPRALVIDVGPGEMLSKIISRYGWDDMRALTPRDISEQPLLTPSVQPITTNRVVHSPPPAVQPISSSSQGGDFTQQALKMLSEMFGYENPKNLLGHSLHSVGLQSMDFIRFAQNLEESTGLTISLSAFVSDTSLEVILKEAATPIN